LKASFFRGAAGANVRRGGAGRAFFSFFSSFEHACIKVFKGSTVLLAICLRKNQNLNFEAYQKVFFRQTSISKVFFRKSYITNRLEGFLL
jgi:hypothetical protein